MRSASLIALCALFTASPALAATSGAVLAEPGSFEKLSVYVGFDGKDHYAGTLAYVSSPESKTPQLVFEPAGIADQLGLVFFEMDGQPAEYDLDVLFFEMDGQPAEYDQDVLMFEMGPDGTDYDGVDVLLFEMGPDGTDYAGGDVLFFEMGPDGEYVPSATDPLVIDLPVSGEGLIVDDIQFMPIELSGLDLVSRPDAEGTTTFDTSLLFRPDAEGTTTFDAPLVFRPDAEGTTTFDAPLVFRPDAEGTTTFDAPLVFVPDKPDLLGLAWNNGDGDYDFEAPLVFVPAKDELLSGSESHFLEVYVDGVDLVVYASWLDEKVSIPDVIGVGVE